jgi:uncharacterized protein YoxC/very-short-patch-repair endonuclease
MGLFDSKKKLEELKQHAEAMQHQSEELQQKFNQLAGELQDRDSTIATLRQEVANLQQELANRDAKSQAYKEKGKQQKQESEQLSNEKAQADEYYIQNIGEYYQFKESVFEVSEQKLYYSLTQWLKVNNKTDYCVFPKLRLADILRVKAEKEAENTAYKEKYNEFHPMVYSITSKHIDFTICKIVTQKANGEYYKHYYVPVVFIELDGTIHQEDENTMKNDEFKNNLFQQLNTPIVRFQNSEMKNLKEDFIPNVLTKRLEGLL